MDDDTGVIIHATKSNTKHDHVHRVCIHVPTGCPGRFDPNPDVLSLIRDAIAAGYSLMLPYQAGHNSVNCPSVKNPRPRVANEFPKSLFRFVYARPIIQ
jgi:hypothetical protein